MIRTLAVRSLSFATSVCNAFQSATKVLPNGLLVHDELIHRYLTKSKCE